MGAEDIARQRPNVLRMDALGAEVRSVTSGSATLKDAINEAMRDWVTNVETTHYVIGSAMGPHPYPTLVRDLQRTIGDEAAAQLIGVEGRLPDLVLACVGGGSNAIGLLPRFIGEPSVRLADHRGRRGGHRDRPPRRGARRRVAGILHGSRSLMLQDRDGQVVEAHSISAGLDYPGVGPQIAALVAAGRVELSAATDHEAITRCAASRGPRASCRRSRRPMRSRPCRGCWPGSRGRGRRFRATPSCSSDSPGVATRISRRSTHRAAS